MQHVMEHSVFFEAGIEEHCVLLALKKRGKAPLTQTTIIRNIGCQHRDLIRRGLSQSRKRSAQAQDNYPDKSRIH